MTPSELWRAVGERLLLERTRRQWNPSDVERAGGPSLKTVQAIEQGRAGRVDSLEAHAAALDLSIVDVLRSVLATQDYSPEVFQIISKFETTTVRGRQALVALAQALPEREPEAHTK